MKAREVLTTLNISRSTLMRYRRRGYIRAKELPNGHFDFNADDVFALKLKGKKRISLAYARVSTYKQKNDLKHQAEELREFAEAKGIELTQVYQDIASGISFKNRDDFFKLLDLVLQGKVKQVVITHKDRLSRVGFDLFKYLFDRYNTEIVVISDEENPKTDQQELFEEIISLLHCFSMRMYSHRRSERKKLEKRLKDLKD
ncbi:IS607 family transposase [Lactobacillus sp. PV037]|uniref:IS607 family transposase n=1 Tax=Lactobacillus sp. PV037 TaxID=2594496 RepID=UPI0022409667|nr:IS607 family transposase [Lactobacillus sp. PV037]QNQ84319.1 IS607 family transposase [Lactobacillus sp. PV037]